ncbi:transcription factor APETALA2, partial [Striga asiatica]
MLSGEMWDLNGSPDRTRYDDSEGGSGEKGKRVGSVSNSGSSAAMVEDGSDGEDAGRSGGRLFGFSLGGGRSSSPVTRQFFPVEEQGTAADFPRAAHWVGGLWKTVFLCTNRLLSQTRLNSPGSFKLTNNHDQRFGTFNRTNEPHHHTFGQMLPFNSLNHRLQQWQTNGNNFQGVPVFANAAASSGFQMRPGNNNNYNNNNNNNYNNWSQQNGIQFSNRPS